MAQKFSKRKIWAAMLAVVVAVSVALGVYFLLPNTTAVYAEEEAVNSEIVGHESDAHTAIGSAGSATWQALSSSNYSISGSGNYYLDGDITGSITIESDATVYLCLNDHTLTNTAGSHTITNYGTLILVDCGENGTVTSTTAHAAIYNYGTASLIGGVYTRETSGTWYVIVNEGTLELTDVYAYNHNASDPSSLIINNLDCDEENPPTLTINSGTYYCAGGNTVKNDEYGIMYINGGIFGSDGSPELDSSGVTWSYQAVQNYGYLEISDGEFYASNLVVTSNGYLTEKVTIKISGGTFTSSSSTALQIVGYNVSNATLCTAEITGGTFSGNVGILVQSAVATISGDVVSTGTRYALGVQYRGSNVTVSGGTFNGTVYNQINGCCSISSGIFSELPRESYWAEGVDYVLVSGYYILFNEYSVDDILGELNDKVETLDELVDSLKELVGSWTDEDETVTVIEKILDLLSDMESAQKNIGSLKKQIAALEEHFGEEGDFTALKDKVEGLESKLTELQEETIKDLTGRVTALEEALADAVEAVLGEGSDGDLADAMENLLGKLSKINETIAALDETYADEQLAASIAALENAYKAADEAIWEAIEALQADVAANTEDINSLTDELNTHSIIIWALVGVVAAMLVGGIVGFVVLGRKKKQ